MYFHGKTTVLQKLVIIFVSALLLSSCKSFGPRQMNTRPLYNDVYHQTEMEQLVKNIVHLRYDEPTAFLQLTSVNTSYSISPSVGLSPSFSYSTSGGLGQGTSWSQSESVGGSTSLSYSDSPSFSYMPLDSKEFVTALLTPMTLNELGVIYTGKVYDLQFIARLLFDTIGNLGNASSAATIRSFSSAPEYKQYYALLRLFGSLIQNNIVFIHEAQIQNEEVFVMIFRSQKDAFSPPAMKLKKMLGVPANADIIFFSDVYDYCGTANFSSLSLTTSHVYESTCPPSNIVHIEMRSIYQIMRYLSYGVDVPQEDINAGNVSPASVHVHWDVLERGLIHIRSSDIEPRNNVYVKTYLHHHWFYVLNSDLETKSTLTFLYRLITLLGGSSGGISHAPVLTLPVNR